MQFRHEAFVVSGCAGTAGVDPNGRPEQRLPRAGDLGHRAHRVRALDAVNAAQCSHEPIAVARGVRAGSAHHEGALDDVQEREVGEAWNGAA